MSVYTLNQDVTLEEETPDRPQPRGSRGSGHRGLEGPFRDVETGVAEMLEATLNAKGLEYARLSARGMTDADIARHLGIKRPSVFDRKATVRKHVAASSDAGRIRQRLAEGDSGWHPDPARNSAGNWQSGMRSPENDVERLRHIPITMHDADGMASAHANPTAGANGWGATGRRRALTADQWRTHDSGGALGNEGHGAPVDLIERAHAADFGEVIERVSREQDRRAARGWPTPQERLARWRRGTET